MTAEELSEQTNPLLNENNGFAFVSGQHQPTLTFTTGMQLSKSKYGTSASSVEGSMFGLQSRRKSKVSSVQSSVTITRKISKFFKRVYKSLMESTAVTSVIILSEDLRARVIISLSLSILYLAAVIVAVKFLATPTFPSIMSFNGFLIAFQLLIGFTAYGVRAVHREFTDSIISAKMIRGTATFKEVGSDARSRNVHDDIYLRISTKICGFILQISLIVLSLSMQWNLVIQSLGNYGCTPATYPTAVLPLPNFGDYLQGDVEFAEIYNYAIPLSDGAVGGKRI